MTLTEIGDALRANPMCWRDVPDEMKTVVRDALLPRGAFTDEQRSFLSLWFLSVTPEDVTAINAALPDGTRVSPIALNDGSLALGSDLLSDDDTTSATYAPARSILETLTLRYVTPDLLPPAQGND